jgi:aldose 1-epimerase
VPFEVIEEASSELYASLLLSKQYNGEAEGFPFPFKTKILFEFNIHDEFKCTTVIKNTGHETMPLGLGWHPYLTTGSKVDDLQLQFKSKCLFKVDEQLIPTEETEPFTTFENLRTIQDFRFDTCFELDRNIQNNEVIVQDDAKNIEIKVWMESGVQKFNYLQVYTREKRDSLAIEPMTCPPNVLNNQKDLIELAPSQSLTLSWGINTSPLARI